MFEKEIIESLRKFVKGDIILETPPDSSLGDFAFPCFSLAKELKKSPVQIAQDIAKSIVIPDVVSKVTATGPYVNFFLDSFVVGKKVIVDVLKKKNKFGSSDKFDGKIAAIEFSSPNIGKPMHFGHLRSTLIGHTLSRMHEFFGYRVVRLNYLGDWGTQFGKLIYAWVEWSDEKKFAECPVKHLVELYVRFGNEAKSNPALQDKAREWFSKLEKGDKMALGLWSKFKHACLDDYRKIYSILGVEFDSFNGESFYAPKVDDAIKLVEKKKLAVLDDGALIVRFPGQEMPMMLRKSDESTTYASRDIATIIDRVETLNFDLLVYEVGHEQALHFEQLFALAKMLGFDKKFFHCTHGLYLNPDGSKMSTREGNVVIMEDVLKEVISLAEKTIEEKNPDLKDKKKIAKDVGVGAMFFGDLLNDRVKDVVFDLKRILSFEGDTGPYLMYTHARASSVLRKALPLRPSDKFDVSKLTDLSEQRLIKLISQFEGAVENSIAQCKPHILAQFLIVFGRSFNEFYHKCPCLQEKDESLKFARLTLIEASRQVLHNGLFLLGISAPEEM